jgi:hypothetical protein
MIVISIPPSLSKSLFQIAAVAVPPRNDNHLFNDNRG